MPVRRLPPHSYAPLRRCIVCRETAPKPELLRIVRRPDGDVVLSTREAGRGAYVHPHPQCLATASAQPKRLARALRRPPPAAVLDRLHQLAEVQSA